MTLARLCLIATSSWLSLLAQSYSFEAIPLEGHNTFAMGINNSGVIIGAAAEPPAGGYHYFWRSPSGELHFLATPLLDYCHLLGINNSGDVVGAYGVVVHGIVHQYGLLIRDGVFSSIQLSDQPFGPRTTVTAINERGDFVGYYAKSGVGRIAFLNAGGVITTIQFPGAVETHPQAIAWDGTIVGCYGRPFSYGLLNAFLRGPKGNFLELKIAGADGVCAMGINNAAHKIVGYAQYEGPPGQRTSRGFVYDYGADLDGLKTTTGARTMHVVFVDYPGGQDTTVTGINAKGTIVGWSQLPAGSAIAFIGAPGKD